MTKTRVEVSKTDSGRLSEVRLIKGKTLVNKIGLEWDSDGILRAVDQEGKKAFLLSDASLIDFLNRKFIEQIEYIADIGLIEEIAKIGKIGSAVIAPKAVALNLSFEYQDAGWIMTGTLAVDYAWTNGYLSGTQALQLKTVNGEATQIFDSPINTNILEALRLTIKSDDVGNIPLVELHYTDLTTQGVQITLTDTAWTQYSITPYPNKLLSAIRLFYSHVAAGTITIDDLFFDTVG